MINKTDFYLKTKSIGTMTSKTGTATYSDMTLTQNVLRFKRDNTGKYWEIDLDKLYSIYTKENFFNTAVIKRNMEGRVNSPSIALLMRVGAIEKNGHKK